MLKRVQHQLNDTIVAYDEHGRLLPEYQGKFEEVIEKVLRDAGDGAKFYIEGFTIALHRDLFKEKKLFNVIRGGKK
jgi:hypothetical protein